MTMNHSKRSRRVNPEAHNTGNLPSSKALDNARQVFINGTGFRQFGDLYHSGGPNLIPQSAATAVNDFYIIFPIVKPAGNTNVQAMGLDVKCWGRSQSTTSYTWDGSPSGSFDVGGGLNDDYDKPHGTSLWIEKGINYNVNSGLFASGKFAVTHFSMDLVWVASLAVYTIPQSTKVIRSLGFSNGQDVQYNLLNDTFNINQPIRGSNGRYDTNGSAGTLCQSQNASDAGEGSLLAHTAKVLFQWGHPVANYMIGTSTGYINVFRSYNVGGTVEFTIPIHGRNLRGGTGIKPINMVLIGEWDFGTKIRVTTSQGSAELVFPGSTTGVNGAELLSITSGLTYDTAGDTLLVEAYVSTTTVINLRTIAFFEDNHGDTV